MTKRLLIDGSFLGENRVALLDDEKLNDYDIEWSDSRPHKSNIYLAKVVRVEPSLQAAFVEYGGNRHGFLPFSEIHPDYYRIPVSDREDILAEEAEDAEAEDDDDDNDGDDNTADENGDDENGDGSSTLGEDSDSSPPPKGAPSAERELEDAREARRRRRALHRYHIQEVIPPNQVLLTQVIKDEHRSKGATLTTYISLAGRYCVLMPNSDRGGGVSRKVTDSATREKLHSLLDDLEVPEGMAVILRTAGSERNSREIRRDFESLLAQWEEIRDRTLDSNAPAQIYDDGSLIKRAIRDIYTNDIEEVLVAGEDAWKQASDAMKTLVPSHARRVKLWKNEKTSLFSQYRVEQTLGNLQSPRVRLRSGGEIVISQTEALVAIDVNSGRATRERNIERTAFKTNLEAAAEAARQLRIRDLSGLIVIDFIDMEANSHIRDVERALKDALRSDRARVQVGRISQFGLLELSRQRLRVSLSDSTTVSCPSCHGNGRVLAPSMAASQALRALIDRVSHRPDREYILKVSPAAANFILNRRRALLISLEERHGTRIEIVPDSDLSNGDSTIEHVVSQTRRPRQNGRADSGGASDVGEGQAETRDIAEDDDRSDGRSAASRSRRRGRRGGTSRRRGDETGETEDGDDAPRRSRRRTRDDADDDDRKESPRSKSRRKTRSDDRDESDDDDRKGSRRSQYSRRRTRDDSEDAGESKESRDAKESKDTKESKDDKDDDKASRSKSPRVKSPRVKSRRKSDEDEDNDGAVSVSPDTDGDSDGDSDDAEESPRRRVRKTAAKKTAAKTRTKTTKASPKVKRKTKAKDDTDADDSDSDGEKSESSSRIAAAKTRAKRRIVRKTPAPTPSESTDNETKKRGWWQKT
ncbi:MAG: Rne/Rng family ribonuclease [Alphaproteobacteria bacterium]|nr:Rne/Rng family ribonuclease [Alphaproteobacteria bacterium]